MFAVKVQTGTEVNVLHHFEVLVVLPYLGNRVSLFLTWRVLTKDVACCETRMRWSYNADQHSISIGTEHEEMFRRVIIGNGSWIGRQLGR